MIVGITGGSGFVGMHLVNKLLANNYKVKVLALETNKDFPNEVVFIKGDLVKKENIAEFLQDVDILIHLAARIMPPDEKMIEDNVLSTYNLISEALLYPIKQIIFTSSVAVYGKDKQGKFKESDTCNPNTPYGLSKYLSEKVILYWSGVTNNPVTIFRPFNIYGPGNYKGVIYSFYSDMKNKNEAIIYGDGKQERDFMYVGDFVDAVMKAIKMKKEGIFNLGYYKKYSILEVFETLKKIMKKDVKVIFNTNEVGKVYNINQDLISVKKELGWEAKIKLEAGLEKTIEWYETN